MRLETRKLYSFRTTREEAQDCANAWQRPVAVYDGKKLRFRVRPVYRTMEDIRKRNEAARMCWFTPSSMRFFSSRVQSAFYGAKDGRAYFVTSERGPSGRRAYSVRVAQLDGSIDTVGEFQGYRTGRAAHAAAREASNG